MDEQKAMKIGMAWLATRAAATILLQELVHVNDGIGPWFDELQNRTITAIKNTVTSGTSMDQETQVIGTAVQAVEQIFDDVRSEASA
jgi:hypothetical protein